VAHIAELERWPSNRCIIADVDRVSRWWTDVGALGVIALAKTRGEGIAACERGAATWLLRDCSIPRLVAALKTICSSRKRRNATSEKMGRETRRVRILRRAAGVMDGVSLGALVPGLAYDLDAGVAWYLITLGAAEEDVFMRSVSVVPDDDPYIAHLTGGIIVTQTQTPRQAAAADKPGKGHRRLVNKRKSQRRS
jgi:hypothetical protein